ncbi:MAG TPA: fused MFS/spermidine synthase [Longimicrobiales bacterium]|nr:fused MFS/spermidine synthase [Longimicrobiales bacterium]
MTPSGSKQRARPTAEPLDITSAAVPTPAVLPWMLLLFVGSGCAALIYEIVWFQLLTLSVGSSAVSLAVVLGTFMGGMCLGSLLLPRFITRAEHPLRVYAFLEAGIGLLGLVILFVLPYAGGLYTAIGGPGFLGLLLRGLVSALVLLPPTLLMGATLPAIARYVEATPRGVAWLGFFYGGNIAGGVFGCLLAGYYLLRVHDMAVATYVAVALNALVAFAGWSFAKFAPYNPPVESAPVAEDSPARGWWPVYVTIALSGMTALGAEVVWTRLLSLTLGGTTYTFSLILAVFLFGLGTGSSIGSFLARSVRNPRIALGICQLLVAFALAWGAALLARALPYWPINPELSPSPWFTFQIDLARAFWVVFPGAVFWGASFPLALADVGRREQDPGRLVGTVYAANTVGAIVGAVIASLLIIAWVGTQNAQRILIAFAALSAALTLVPVFSRETRKLQLNSRSGMVAMVLLVVAFVLGRSVARIPDMLVAYGRYMVTWLPYPREFLFVGEGMNSSMAVTRMPNGLMNYHNAGKVQASSEPQDMRLQRMLGHLTTLVPDSARNVLVIGCGAGVTAGAVSIDPGVRREVIAEIEPLVPYAVSTYFSGPNFSVITNPKVEVKIDDARHYLLTTDETFDAITSDPFDPWVKGAATLYTKEFFEVIRDHLNPGGVVTVFVQLYEAGMPAVKSEIATFLEVFPNGVVFGNTHQGGGYDVVLLGQKDPKPIDIDKIEEKLRRPEYAPVAQSLAEIGFYSATDLFGRYAAQGPMLKPWLTDAQINRDRNLRLQYLAGLGINAYQQREIYEQILSHRQWPEGLFTGSPQTIDALRNAMMQQ